MALDSREIWQILRIYAILWLLFGSPKRAFLTLILVATVGGWFYWKTENDIWRIQTSDPGYRVVSGTELQGKAIMRVGVPPDGDHWVIDNKSDEWLVDMDATCIFRWPNGQIEGIETQSFDR